MNSRSYARRTIEPKKFIDILYPPTAATTASEADFIREFREAGGEI